MSCKYGTPLLLFLLSLEINPPIKVVCPLFNKTLFFDFVVIIIDFLASKEVGEILSHQGLFPSLNNEVDNKLDKGNKFMWVGWDYIYKNDIPKLIAKCEKMFNGGE